MNRIEALFNRQPKDNLTVYFTAGFPSLNDTVTIAEELTKVGADLIEIGMPYSDPLADGPTIQASSKVALENGMTLEVLFEQLADLRLRTQIPTVLMGYYNQVLQYGIESFCKKANEVGIDGLILPDLPLEEYESKCKSIFEKYGLTCSFLITPSSSDARIIALDNASKGFLYAVSSHSITGSDTELKLENYGLRLRDLDLKNPIQVGFGISDFASYQYACSISNGAIIGSAFIKAIQKDGDLIKNIHGFVQLIRQNQTV